MEVRLVGVTGRRSGARGRRSLTQQPDRAAESQDAPKCRRPVTVDGRALALQGAGRPADLTCHVGHRGACAETVGDLAQLRQRPGRRLVRRVVGRQCGGQLDQRSVMPARDAQLGQRNPAVAQLGRRCTEQPGQRTWTKSQAHERVSASRVDERSRVRPGDDDPAGHPDEIHAAVGQHPDRLGRPVHDPRTLDELAEPRRRREFAVAHFREVTAESATPRRRSRCPARPAGA